MSVVHNISTATVVCYSKLSSILINSRARFPGAPTTQMTTKLEFVTPTQLPVIPTYTVMNSEGNLEDQQRQDPEVSVDQALVWYKNMLTCKVIYYLVSTVAATGEEAVMIGSAAALEPQDVITCQYRETGVFIQRGFTLEDLMNQLTSNKDDPGKGRNMPVHYSGRKKVGAHAVASTLGTQIPHAVGAAYALKMQSMEDSSVDPAVAAAYFGDGAASEGDFHAALNIAALRKCPVIFICRNNGYAISTPTSEQYRGDGIAGRGAGYGVDSLRVDGADIFAVYEATKEARKRALENGGQPILLELMSYRLSHHSTSDDSAAYRSSDEMTSWRTQYNPIDRLRNWLIHQEVWDDKTDQLTRRETRNKIIKALGEAEKTKKPALKEIFTDVYAELTEEQEEQRDELKRLIIKFPNEYDIGLHEGGLEGL
ncbi:hypothetical protein HYE67_002967 [Fusarium culmorum]|uniref:2-oxoisovalerate dehydrogenase subunit alpha n=1 Tax=Fusarium culmorum TaxID=5516 RepID=A0A7S8D2E7_FUSCU|nr:hypothetical protein HYE67_002967 [Fusarium culmorum]